MRDHTLCWHKARSDQTVQLLAVEDIGKFVAPIFADPFRFGGQTLDVASDTVTGAQIDAAFSKAAGRPSAYSRFPNELLTTNPFLSGLTALLAVGKMRGDARHALLPDHPFSKLVLDCSS